MTQHLNPAVEWLEDNYPKPTVQYVNTVCRSVIVKFGTIIPDHEKDCLLCDGADWDGGAFRHNPNVTWVGDAFDGGWVIDDDGNVTIERSTS